MGLTSRSYDECEGSSAVADRVESSAAVLASLGQLGATDLQDGCGEEEPSLHRDLVVDEVPGVVCDGDDALSLPGEAGWLQSSGHTRQGDCVA